MSLDTLTFNVKVVDEPLAGAVRRIFLNNDIIKGAKIATGDLLALRAVDGEPFAAGIVWPNASLPSNSIQISSTLTATAGVQDGSKAHLSTISSVASTSSLTPPEIKEASSLICSALSGKPGGTLSTGSKAERLVAYVKELLVDVKYITTSQILNVEYHGVAHQFRVSWAENEAQVPEDVFALSERLNGLSLRRPISPFEVRLVGWDTDVVLKDTSAPTNSQPDSAPDAIVAHSISAPTMDHDEEMNAFASVGGLDRQIAEIRNLIELPLQRPDLFRRFGIKPPRGVLLHGPPGTGKTRLAHAIATSTRSSLILIHGPELSSAYHGETEAALRQVFQKARKQSPCVIVLDELDALCPKREEGSGEVEKRVVATLLTLMDGMADEDEKEGGRVIVVGTTNRVNTIDPALRRPGRFDREIEIGIPDATARLAILHVLLARIPHSLDDDTLKPLADRTHGYVGADLAALVRDAGTLAIHRWLDASKLTAAPKMTAELTNADLLNALPGTRPSAMREVFIETPSVRWSDIGGQQSVKEKLKECVEWPLLYPKTFERLGVTPPKGVLLYGPPGCSKTLTAKALATESGINFLAVKGPELLNKYVGESERAIREIFRKARAAAPSIIFFEDEIDALGSMRTSGDNAGGAHEGMLTTLLNEMDGIQELVGVTIVAATNRPDVIDSALMRPGRLDRILYVGPPDLEARMEILKIRTAKMAVEPGIDFHDLAVKTTGCSGAEIAALCQEAALAAMKENIDAAFVGIRHFRESIDTARRGITPEVVERFKIWSETSGVRHA